MKIAVRIRLGQLRNDICRFLVWLGYPNIRKPPFQKTEGVLDGTWADGPVIPTVPLCISFYTFFSSKLCIYFKTLFSLLRIKFFFSFNSCTFFFHELLLCFRQLMGAGTPVVPFVYYFIPLFFSKIIYFTIYYFFLSALALFFLSIVTFFSTVDGFWGFYTLFSLLRI